MDTTKITALETEIETAAAVGPAAAGYAEAAAAVAAGRAAAEKVVARARQLDDLIKRSNAAAAAVVANYATTLQPVTAALAGPLAAASVATLRGRLDSPDMQPRIPAAKWGDVSAAVTDYDDETRDDFDAAQGALDAAVQAADLAYREVEEALAAFQSADAQFAGEPASVLNAKAEAAAKVAAVMERLDAKDGLRAAQRMVDAEIAHEALAARADLTLNASNRITGLEPKWIARDTARQTLEAKLDAWVEKEDARLEELRAWADAKAEEVKRKAERAVKVDALIDAARQ